MITEEWQPTVELRFEIRKMNPHSGVHSNILQQRWTRKVIEYRDYGGRPRRCEGYDEEWRDVPSVPARETLSEHGK